MLSELFASGGYQLRHSPVGFRSQFHCTPNPQWVFILGGEMEIGLQGGVSRIFKPGQHFYSADVLPAGATFDAAPARPLEPPGGIWTFDHAVCARLRRHHGHHEKRPRQHG
jgi:hypothetical protein